MVKKTAIVYNAQYGGFALSEKAIARYCELSGFTLHVRTDESGLGWDHYTIERGNGQENILDYDIPRTDPNLVRVVEELGPCANGRCATLKIRKLKPGTKYKIDDYDGNETVHTIDEYQWEVA